MRGFVTGFTSTADYGVDIDSDVFITTGSVSRFFLWECLSWFVLQQIVSGFAVPAAAERFNAIASCIGDTPDSAFNIALNEGQITQTNGRQLLQIAVTDQLTQESGFSAETVATIMCDFDVQLVREITGTTDVALNRDSTAVGQTLLNVPVQWSAQ